VRSGASTIILSLATIATEQIAGSAIWQTENEIKLQVGELGHCQHAGIHNSLSKMDM
jgi:hypothetical protein